MPPANPRGLLYISPIRRNVEPSRIPTASSSHHGRWIRKEAAMAAIAFNAAQLSEREPTTVTAQFRPLDPGIVNEAIPAFFIGRNREGFWVARDVNGRIGGILLLEDSAVSFARRQSGPAACATIFPSERFELDLENSGNPLVPQLGPLMRLWQRIAALIGK
jgi:hypothetical protein